MWSRTSSHAIVDILGCNTYVPMTVADILLSGRKMTSSILRALKTPINKETFCFRTSVLRGEYGPWINGACERSRTVWGAPAPWHHRVCSISRVRPCRWFSFVDPGLMCPVAPLSAVWLLPGAAGDTGCCRISDRRRANVNRSATRSPPRNGSHFGSRRRRGEVCTGSLFTSAPRFCGNAFSSWLSLSLFCMHKRNNTSI